MTEDINDTDNGYPGVQVGTFIKGDQWVFRAASGDDFKAVVTSVAKNADEIVTALGTIKQVAVAKGVFSGDSDRGSGGKTTSRSKDGPPPDDDISFYKDSDGVKVASVECSHGPMLDLRDKGYKADLYCSLDTKDWKKKCKPVKL